MRQNENHDQASLDSGVDCSGDRPLVRPEFAAATDLDRILRLGQPTNVNPGTYGTQEAHRSPLGDLQAMLDIWADLSQEDRTRVGHWSNLPAFLAPERVEEPSAAVADGSSALDKRSASAAPQA